MCTDMGIVLCTKLELRMNDIICFAERDFFIVFHVIHTFQKKMTIFKLKFSIYQKQKMQYF